MDALFLSVFTTRWGSGAVYATHKGVCKVELPDMTHSAGLPHEMGTHLSTSPVTDYAAMSLQRYYAGERVHLEDIPVDLSGLPPFRATILNAIRQIRYGEVWSYGRVAASCGIPRAARAVGGALAANPVPLIIPCHRIVGADGSLTGFSAAGGTATKRVLLEMEGIVFTGVTVARIQLVMHR